MLTLVERVLILKSADLLKDIGPRHLLGLAELTREIEIAKGQVLYEEEHAADALYIVVEGRVRLSTGDKETSQVGPGEAFGTWALVDDSRRGQRAECLEDGMALMLQREDFYDRAAADLTLLREVVRVLAQRLRTLVTDRPEEARIEGEGIEKPEEPPLAAEPATAPTPGETLEAAALGQPTAAPEDERVTPGDGG
jgi:CRP-like cAMP-binding protein